MIEIAPEDKSLLWHVEPGVVKRLSVICLYEKVLFTIGLVYNGCLA